MMIHNFECTINENNGVDNGNKVIFNIIDRLTKFSNKIVTEIHVEVMTEDSTNENNSDTTFNQGSSSNYICIDSNTLEVVKVNGSNVNDLCEFINFFRSIINLDILMNTGMYGRFRSKFTELYYKAFFNGHKNCNFTLDTDEVNQILKYLKIGYIISSQNIDGRIFYKVVDDNCSINRQEWISQLKEFDNSWDKHQDRNQMTSELEGYIKSFHIAFKRLTNTEYRTFTSGFRGIYNNYVTEKYDKITIQNINNILAFLRIPYEVSRKKEFYYISKKNEEVEE